MIAQANNAKAKIVNGISVDDLAILVDGVEQDAEKAKTNWHVTTVREGQARSHAQVDGSEIGGRNMQRQFSFDIDEPRELNEERFLEQFAALEESLALLETNMRRMSETAKLFGSLARRIRQSACPTTLS